MSDQGEDEQERDELDRRMERADFEETTTAAIGVGTRSLRTIWASMVSTPRVIEAVLKKTPDYTPPIPLFLVLFALQLTTVAVFGLPGAPTTEVISDSMSSPAVVEAWLASAGAPAAEVDAAIQRAYDYALWPITILAALPYILLLWAMKPSRSVFSHTLIYFITINASFGAIFLSLLLAPIWPQSAPMIGMLAGFGVYYVATARALRSFYARSWFGVSWRMLIFFIVLLPSLILIQGGMFLAVDIALQPFDLSIIELFINDFQSVANPEPSP